VVTVLRDRNTLVTQVLAHSGWFEENKSASQRSRIGRRAEFG